MQYIFRYIAYIKRIMSYIFRFMSYIRRIMSYIFRYMSYIFRKLPNCRKKLPKSLELKSILHKKYCLQQRFVAIVGLGLFSESLFFNIFFCLYLWRLGNNTPLLLQAAKRCAQLAYLTLVFCTMNRFKNKWDLVLRERNSLISSLSIKIV